MNGVPDGYFLMEPREPFPGCLGVLLRTSNLPTYLELESQKTARRYFVRALLGDHIPLTGEAADLVSKPSDALVWVKGNPLTLNLEFPRYLRVFYDLVPSPDGRWKWKQIILFVP